MGANSKEETVPTPFDQSDNPRRARIVAAVPVVVLISCATLSACGGSSHPATTSNHTETAQANTQTIASAAATSANGQGKQPSNTGGTTGSNGAHNGTTGANGGTPNNHGQPPSQQGTAPKNLPNNFVVALRTFTACVRAHGLNIPEPNLSGHGEIFPKSSVNPNNPNYRPALQACQADLIAILRAAAGNHIHGIG
jgi:hypothetical protein